jgi:hypothetical protein
MEFNSKYLLPRATSCSQTTVAEQAWPTTMTDIVLLFNKDLFVTSYRAATTEFINIFGYLSKTVVSNERDAERYRYFAIACSPPRDSERIQQYRVL